MAKPLCSCEGSRIRELVLPRDLPEILRNLRIHLECSDLDLKLFSEGGSQNPKHRLYIRQQILKQFPFLDPGVIMNLEVPPEGSSTRLSISHTTSLGGYASVANRAVGLDLELSTREVEKAVRRMICGEEAHFEVSPKALWVGKEAAFKALRHYSQPEVLSQIETSSWRKAKSPYETFELKNPGIFDAPSGRGCVFLGKSYCLGVFLFSKTS